ncbi:MAG TPA: MFS transporter [Pseudonocardiaceae bacterium]|nr:MFS transporter [Pseudonocardiaceae bacterium]
MDDQRASVLSRTFSSLRTRNFRLFFFGQLVSNSGNWLTTVAITLLVLHRSGSGASVGLLAVCQFGPLLVLSPFAGLVADRSNKRHLLYLTQGLEMVESFVLAVLAFVPHSPLPAFYVTALAGGTLLAFDNPARRSFVNEMVKPEDVPNAVTLYSAMNSLSRVIGPTIAGGLIVGLGYGWCFTIDGASYLVVLGALALMRPDELRRAPQTRRGAGQVRAGLRYVASVPELWISFGMLALIGTASYNFTVVLPLYVEHGLRGTDLQYTLLYAAFSCGGVLGTLVVARRTAISLRTIVLSAGLFGVALFGLFLAPNIYAAYPLAVLIGGTSVSYMTATTAIAQLRTQRDMIGRVLALQTVLLIGTTPIGGPILGVVSDLAGGRAPVLVGGIAAVLAALLGLLAARRLRSG